MCVTTVGVSRSRALGLQGHLLNAPGLPGAAAVLDGLEDALAEMARVLAKSAPGAARMLGGLSSECSSVGVGGVWLPVRLPPWSDARFIGSSAPWQFAGAHARARPLPCSPCLPAPRLPPARLPSADLSQRKNGPLAPEVAEAVAAVTIPSRLGNTQEASEAYAEAFTTHGKVGASCALAGTLCCMLAWCRHALLQGSCSAHAPRCFRRFARFCVGTALPWL